MNSRKIAIVFSSVLRELRQKKALSQEKLAFECGLDRSYISLLEMGRQLPSLKTMLALSHGLQVSFSKLAFLIEEKLETTIDE